MCQYFPSSGHICGLLWMNLCFTNYYLEKYVSVCIDIVPGLKGDILFITLESALERKKILYVLYNGPER